MKSENAEPRIDYKRVAPKAIQALWAVERYAHESNIKRPLLELVKLPASMMNGCAYCVDMHSKDARALGESEQRLYALTFGARPRFSRQESVLLWHGLKR